MSEEKAKKLLRLDEVSRELKENLEGLRIIQDKMDKFSRGLDLEYRTLQKRIKFEDIDEEVYKHDRFVFNFTELKELFNIEKIRELLIKIRILSEEKQKLESELDVTYTPRRT